MNGGPGNQIGLGKSYKVYLGDYVKIEAYAKYEGGSATPSGEGFAAALLSAFNLTAPGIGETGTPCAALEYYGGLVDRGHEPSTGVAAFVTILVFDKDYNFLTSLSDQIATSAEQVGVSPNVPHDRMFKDYLVTEPGYVYMYFSNHSNTSLNVYFDDVMMSYSPSNVIQYNEYYPYGMQTNASWTRDNHSNNFLYDAGGEMNATTGWYDLFYRNYDPALGRFMQVDPLAVAYTSLSSYHYGGNNPIM